MVKLTANVMIINNKWPSSQIKTHMNSNQDIFSIIVSTSKTIYFRIQSKRAQDIIMCGIPVFMSHS